MVFMILFLVALCSNLLETINPIFGYVDEIIVFLFMGAAFIKTFFLEKQQRKMLDGWSILAFILCSCFLLIAMIPNLFDTAHSTIWMQLYTFFGMVKFLILFYCGHILLQGTHLLSTIPWMKKVAWLLQGYVWRPML
ncbi:hypothetical protein BMT55_12870 [Listeria newyorkensis]|uniref:Uncharacterized protein n=1 Tax=Listeria newyorkensis TaxID=1497681 RepID=A0ABX4XK83_9LIST|nr:hypothetical protein EP58_03660 [Listeria newyorkensis]PNP89384.1 hypothetical protein BMT55_12870 [Listeria newyorkensis]